MDVSAWNIVIIILSLALSAFFSGMEIAYVSANKIHIEIEKRQDDFLAKVLRRLTKKPSQFIATMLVGNNLALVIYGFFMGEVLVNLGASHLPALTSPGTGILLQTVLSTIIILVTAEFLPKVFFQIYANTFLKVFAIPAYLFYLFFWIISRFVIWISDTVLRLFFKTEGDEVQLTFTKIELGNYISEQMEHVEEADEVDSEIQIFQNALEFNNVKSREVMVPRTEIQAVDRTTPIKELKKVFIDTGYTKLLIYEDSIDKIVGYVHSHDLFKKPHSIQSILIPPVYVPESMKVQDALSNLIGKRKSMAVVLDEYGGTSGIMTVEDIVEELFGEIEDEHDSIALVETILEPGVYKLSARMEVDHLNEQYKLELPESENYETIGGMIVNQTEDLPDEDDEIIIDNRFKFTILEVSNTKIDLVKLELLEN